jgi:eukaryotic-like serine/threonine-protein kinase
MPPKVTLTITSGSQQGQTFEFSERTTCIIGRSPDCNPRLPDDADHKAISRHHCLLDINPPDIRIRDFGSRNGTYVNSVMIGKRDFSLTPEEAARAVYPEHDLKDGDEIKLGQTVFRVSITNRTVVRIGKKCRICGTNVTREQDQQREGDVVCTTCRGDPARLARRIMDRGDDGVGDRAALPGYTILREIGRGAMGAVFLARRDATGEQVALKLMLPQVATSAEARARFLREAENTRALKHPNIVAARDAGCTNGVFYLTLEYCDGGSVDKLITQRGGRVALDEAIALTLQVLDGLDFGHSQQLVHRDIKPANVFLAHSGSRFIAKIGDYGLSKAFDQAGLGGQTRTGATAGTPRFMPRQQLISFRYSHPSVDVWATAATLYAMVTGTAPRDFPPGRDPWSIVLQTDAVPIRRRVPSVPSRVAEVIDTALIDQPSIRFESAAAFKRALERAL